MDITKQYNNFAKDYSQIIKQKANTLIIRIIRVL